MSELKNIPEAWHRAWQSSTFRNYFAISILVFLAVSLCNFHFLRVWQLRNGSEINDIILNQLRPHNFSVPIFVLEYSALLLVLVFVLPHPDRLLIGIQTFTVVLALRTIAVYLVPLEPPRDMIFLTDPFANLFLHRDDIVVTKDLFFSGHISAITILILVTSNTYLKRYALFCGFAVAIMILWQHVHYSMDVACAPVISYLSFKAVMWLNGQTKYGLVLKDAY